MSPTRSHSISLVACAVLLLGLVAWVAVPIHETAAIPSAVIIPAASRIESRIVATDPTPLVRVSAPLSADDVSEQTHAQLPGVNVPSKLGTMEIVVVDKDSALGSEHPTMVKIVSHDPSLSTWFAQAELIQGRAHFANLPLNSEFEIGLASEALGESLSVTIAGPTQGKSSTAFELDLATEIRKRGESAAIATLRSIASAQQQLQASGAIDTDGDGGGEFGYFGELAGARPMRKYTAQGPAMGGDEDVLDPAYLAAVFGNISASNQAGLVQRQGYNYLIYLPGSAAFDGGPLPGLAESTDGGAGSQLPDSSAAEILWSCFAWPIENQASHNRAFFINQEGDVLATDNTSGLVYAGLYAVPAFDAALSSGSPRDMGAKLGLETLGRLANDGNAWVPAQ